VIVVSVELVPQKFTEVPIPSDRSFLFTHPVLGVASIALIFIDLS
jgi:hypothetical protein